jgi:hypothetical protein
VILRNYKVLKGIALNQNIQNYSPSTVSLPNLKDMEGNVRTSLPIGETVGGGARYYISGVNGTKTLWNNLNFVVGTGTTEPTVNDFQLENDVTSSFSNCTIAKTIDQVGNTYTNELTFLCMGKNNTNADITLNEIGIYRSILFTNSFYQDNVWANMLFIRHLFDEPLTVPPNETFKITLVWKED